MDDILKLNVKLLDPEEPDGIVANFDEYRVRACLKSHLRYQTESRLPSLQSIRKRDAEVADYLEHLEAQIVQLAVQVSYAGALSSENSYPDTAVNMSSNGLRFETDMHLSPGQQVELGMILSTSGMQLVAVADVLRVEPAAKDVGQGGSRYQVSTRYSRIHPDDTEAIIRHLAKLQLMQLQARREV